MFSPKPVYTTTEFGKPLIYNFNTTSKLEIQTTVKRPFGGVRKNWITVTPNIFRSYHGTRRVDGNRFKGIAFYWMSNQTYGSPSTTKEARSKVNIIVVRKPRKFKTVNIRIKMAERS